MDIGDGVRSQLLEGLPARVQGMAEELLTEWQRAVEAVPQLAPAASAEVIGLLRLSPRHREYMLRLRWRRHHEADGVNGDRVELVGVPRAPADARETA